MSYLLSLKTPDHYKGWVLAVTDVIICPQHQEHKMGSLVMNKVRELEEKL